MSNTALLLSSKGQDVMLNQNRLCHYPSNPSITELYKQQCLVLEIRPPIA